MSGRISLTRVYPHPPEVVWRALTDPAALSEWLMPTTDFAARVGCKFTFRAPPVPGWRGIVECEVLEVEPRRRIVFSWAGHANMREPTRVSWTLEAVPGGTRFTLEHTGFVGVRGFVDRLFLKLGMHEIYDTALSAALERTTADGYRPSGVWMHDRTRRRAKAGKS